MLRAGSSAFGATGLVGGFIAALERAVAAQSAFQPRQFVLHQPRVVLRQPRQFVLRHKRSIPRPRLQARTGETSGQATGRVADANRMHMDCAGAGRSAPIIGATKMHHLKELIEAVEIELRAEEIATIEKPYQPHPVVGHEQPNARQMASA